MTSPQKGSLDWGNPPNGQKFQNSCVGEILKITYFFRYHIQCFSLVSSNISIYALLSLVFRCLNDLKNGVNMSPSPNS